jgi:hypothetical protein
MTLRRACEGTHDGRQPPGVNLTAHPVPADKPKAARGSAWRAHWGRSSGPGTPVGHEPPSGSEGWPDSRLN